MPMSSIRSERGFTLMELLVASVVTVIVLGMSVALTSQIQNGYRRQIEDSAGEQEGRYALDFIGRYIRGAANNPTGASASECPTAGATNIDLVQFDPDGDNIDDDVRLLTDANPPDGLFGGAGPFPAFCNQANEDVTISLDPMGTDTIVFLDNNTGGAVSTRTDTVIEDLQFIFRNSAHAVLDTATANPDNVVYIETRITIRTRTLVAAAGAPQTRILTSEVKIRSRG
jgi:prepilin-type N-terminal cleavage/methylation domain-containing protein